MAFCGKCGGELLEGARFCNSCGSAAAAPASVPAAPAAAPEPVAAAPVSAAGSGMTSNVAGLLTYVCGFITGIVFLVLEPYNKDKFVRFHAFQSIFFNVLMIGFWIVWTILSMIMWAIGFRILGYAIGSLISTVMSLVSLVVFLAFLITWVFLMFKAYNNQRFELPWIGKLAARQAG
jgi:uncharacterized membrane protein